MASGSAGNGGPGQADMVTQVERVRGGVQMSLCMTYSKERYITFATLHVGIIAIHRCSRWPYTTPPCFPCEAFRHASKRMCRTTSIQLVGGCTKL